MTTQPQTTQRPFEINRVFNASRERVFQAWTDPECLMHWWGPKGFTMKVCSLDLRSGGVFHYSMQSPDGHGMWGKFVYRDIVSPERLVFVVSFSDEAGAICRHPFSDSWPLEVLSTLTLTEQDGKTTMTLHAVPINATETECEAFEAGLGSMKQGWTGTLEQLEAYLSRS